jgi:hypothetical protein
VDWIKIEGQARITGDCLLYIPGSARQEIVIGYLDDEGDWMERAGESSFPIDMPVTHYMPLPQNP